ncbi:uncharacterized protein K02A2.6-like [Phymastichus coffea]|uniref:uncharacterized protein K02A2.6-like n=1 Tax=Phymastichus coffea TaxID=108790 RepID=UPI00273B13C7|nr:uncharacterized protein K02A2.6-like [Phymastichus coffea]
MNILSVDAFNMRELVNDDVKIQYVINSLCNGKKLCHQDTWNVDPKEFSVENNFLFKQDRIVIPEKLRQRVLEELHAGHFGIVKMKNLARGHCWWPNIDKDIEKVAHSCESCILNRNNPSKVPIHPWEPATRPFERVHVDFAGPFLGVYLFILVDAFSKWPEIKSVVKNMLISTTIDVCLDIFTQFGLPEIFFSDNGRTFIAEIFELFLKEHGILHKFSAPYHPASNGQAERFVQMIKVALKKACDTTNIADSIRKILVQYRNMPHCITGKTPAELFLGRKMRGKLDLLNPTPNKKLPVNNFNKFHNNQKVLVRNYVSGAKWLFGKILGHKGNLLYKVELRDGKICTRHANQISAVKATESCDNSDYFVPDSERVSLYETGNLTKAVPTIAINAPEPGTSESISSSPKRKTKSPVRYPENEYYFEDKSS